MNENIKLILILTVLLLIGGAAFVGYRMISNPPVQNQGVETPSSSTQTYGGFGNTITVSNQNQPQGQTQQPQNQPSASTVLTGMSDAYRTLFGSLSASRVDFSVVSATSTGDLKSIYALYGADVKAQQQADPNSGGVLYGALVDLTGDGSPEALISEQLPYFCGTAGCALDVYQKKGTTWTKILSTFSSGEVGLGNVIYNGYTELYVTGQVQGGRNQSVVILYRWNGSAYVPAQVVAAWDGSAFRLAH